MENKGFTEFQAAKFLHAHGEYDEEYVKNIDIFKGYEYGNTYIEDGFKRFRMYRHPVQGNLVGICEILSGIHGGEYLIYSFPKFNEETKNLITSYQEKDKKVEEVLFEMNVFDYVFVFIGLAVMGVSYFLEDYRIYLIPLGLIITIVAIVYTREKNNRKADKIYEEDDE